MTTFFLDHDIDTGRIIMKKPFAIPDDADVEYVYDGLMHLGAALCLETLEAIIAADGHPQTYEQQQAVDGSPINTAPKIFKETCEIDWTKTAKQVYDFVRGLSPYPGAWTTLVAPDGRETVLKIYKSRKTMVSGSKVQVSGAKNQESGQLVLDGKSLFVACADGLLEIVELQLAGKKRMQARDFLNGMKDIMSYRVR